jgi:hypothetical protein
MYKGVAAEQHIIKYGILALETSLETFKNSEMDSFFVFAEILVVFQLVSYYSFLSTVGVIK